MTKSLIGVSVVGDKTILVDIYDDGADVVKMNGKNFILSPDSTFGPDDPRTSAITSKHPGIRPRWARVVGISDYAEKSGIKLGDKVLLDTMKWTRGVHFDKEFPKDKVWSIKVDDVIAVDDEGFTEDELKKMDGKKHMGGE